MNGEKGKLFDAEAVLRELTAEEKVALVSGTDFMHTNPIPRLGVPSVCMSDGPHGLRKQAKKGDNGVGESEPATAFPTAAALACSWDEENARKVGAAIGEECRHYGVDVLLGPGLNIKRNPLCGRNFEYYSEDPCLAGALGAAFVEGVQSAGVDVSLKHFALNNLENYRFVGDSVADERAMREIYLKPFEIAVKRAKPATVMCAYNAVNGTPCSENAWLLRDVLRREWGFDGLVMTDWGGTRDRVKGVNAGVDLEMPGDSAYCRRALLDGLREGTLSEAALSEAAGNVLRLAQRAGKEPLPLAVSEHAALAADVAAECAVLLKNDGALPLSSGELFVAGELFARMRYQGAGSSMIRPTQVISPKAAFDARGVRYVYARGYRADGEADECLLAEAERAANETKGKLALVFAGLTDLSESEGADREDMRLPRCQEELIERLAAAGRQIVLVLFGGSPMELPFAEKCSAILHMCLPGQSGGEAVARLLFGEVSPSGKLAETWAERYEDVPHAADFCRGEAELYKESVFVGYRYFSTFGRRVRYPFGFGLSYTSFVYRDLRLFREGGFVEASFFLRNAGACDGAEIVQLYTGKEKSDIFRPKRELRAHKKVRLAAGEEREVRLRFAERELAAYDAARGEWTVEGGDYTVEIAASSEDVRLSGKIFFPGENLSKPSAEVLAAYQKDAAHVSDEVFAALLGRALPAPRPIRPITMDTRFCDYKVTPLGRTLCGMVNAVLRGRLKRAQKMPEGAERENAIKGALFLKRLFDTGCMRNCAFSAGRLLPHHVAEAAVHLANGRILRAIARLCRPYRAPRLPKDVQKKRPPQ